MRRENLTNGISGDRLMASVRHLDSIGIRFAGTAAEAAAANWIEDEFRRLGLSRIHQQEFPCLSFSYSKCELKARSDGLPTLIPSEPAAHSPSTHGGGIRGALTVLEKIPTSRTLCRQKVKGNIVLLQNSEFFEFSRFKRVMASRPAALLLVDDRFPNDWTVAIGFPRSWVDYLSCPIVNIPYATAWELTRRLPLEISLDLSTVVSEAVSQNVIAEIKGSSHPDEIIVVSGHHDTVLNNSGSDDNSTGVAAVLELARYFVARKPGRTLRFISYGTEEQLSEGARNYVLKARDISKIRFNLNIDSIGAWMGRTGIYYCGPAGVKKVVDQVAEQLDVPVHTNRELSPFSDHFPLNYCGVPAVWYYRTTYAAARHYHHSALETPNVVSPSVMTATVKHQAGVLEALANAGEMPFRREIPAGQMSVLRKMAAEWCGRDRLPRV